MTAETFAAMAAVGLLGGVWNAVAGGATLFTFPALMALGLPPIVANATNFVALAPANAVALLTARAELRAAASRLGPCVLAAGVGALIGSTLLLASGDALFLSLVPGLILLATALFAFGERIRRWLARLSPAGDADKPALALLFLVSIYGGYFGAGAGVVFLAAAQIMAFTPFAAANAVKNLLATVMTAVSIAVFGAGGLVDWPAAAAVMAGCAIGGYVGGRAVRLVNERLMRGAVIVFGVVLAGVYAARI